LQGSEGEGKLNSQQRGHTALPDRRSVSEEYLKSHSLADLTSSLSESRRGRIRVSPGFRKLLRAFKLPSAGARLHPRVLAGHNAAPEASSSIRRPWRDSGNRLIDSGILELLGGSVAPHLDDPPSNESTAAEQQPPLEAAADPPSNESIAAEQQPPLEAAADPPSNESIAAKEDVLPSEEEQQSSEQDSTQQASPEASPEEEAVSPEGRAIAA